MNRLCLALVVVSLAGCNDILLNTDIDSNIQNIATPCGGCGTECGSCGLGSPTSSVDNLRCEVAGAGPHSRCTLQWDGLQGPFAATATHSSLPREDYPAVSPGFVFDPGPLGSGGGTWTITLTTAPGAPTVSVTLDS